MSVGQQLSEARHALGLTVADISQRTRIRVPIIDAMEHDDFAMCGGDAYARGHLRVVARAVGLDPDLVLKEYDEQHQPELPVTPFPPSGEARRGSWGVVLLMVALIALIAVGAWALIV